MLCVRRRRLARETSRQTLVGGDFGCFVLPPSAAALETKKKKKHSRRCLPLRALPRAHTPPPRQRPVRPSSTSLPPPLLRGSRGAHLSHGRKRPAAHRPAGPAQESVSLWRQVGAGQWPLHHGRFVVRGGRGRRTAAPRPALPNRAHRAPMLSSPPASHTHTQHPTPAPTRHTAQPTSCCCCSTALHRVRPPGRAAAAPGRRARRAVCAAPAAGGQGGAGGGEGGGGRAGCESGGGETPTHTRTPLPRRDARAYVPPTRRGLHWRRPTHRRPPRSRVARLIGKWAHHPRR